MLQQIFHIADADFVPYLDATDALAAAYCHYLQRGRLSSDKPYCDWADYVAKNASKVIVSPRPSNTK